MSLGVSRKADILREKRANMFYEVLMEKRAGSAEEYYNPSPKVLRAKRILSAMSPDDQMEAIHGATYDYGIDDERELRDEIKKRRAIAGGVLGIGAGAALGYGIGKFHRVRKGVPAAFAAPTAKEIGYGAGLGMGLGALAGYKSVSNSEDPVYTGGVKRVRSLQRRLPKLSVDDKKMLMDIM
jgi:hypothetical protein